MIRKLILVATFLLILIARVLSQVSFAQTELSATQRELISKYEKESQEYKNKGELKKTAQLLGKIAFIYLESKQFNNAIESFKEAANISAEIKSYSDVKTIYSNIGLIYTDQENYPQALNYFDKSLKVRRFIGKDEDISAGLTDVAYVLTIQAQHMESIKKLLEALDLAMKANNQRLILKCYAMLMENYRALGITSKYQEYFNKYTDYQTYVQKENIKEQYTEEQIKTLADKERTELESKAKVLELELINLAKKVNEDELKNIIKRKDTEYKLQEEENKRKQKELELLKKEDELKAKTIEMQNTQQRQQQIIIYGSGTMLLLLIALAILMLKNIRNKRRDNRLLERQNFEIAAQKVEVEKKSHELEAAFKKIKTQNKNITDSINYAQKIQRAMMPEEHIVMSHLQESFIFFRPRDIVSGDYYWFQSVNRKVNGVHENKVFMAAVDCTGHGVPGALLSMVGYNLLDDIVLNRHVTKANRILEELHKGIRSSLKQQSSDNRDGMDIALCVYDKNRNVVEFAGAKNPLFYFQNGAMIKIKGDVMPIGGFKIEEGERLFTNNEVEITSPTTFYVFSDGFADQFGGDLGRKFMISRFRDLLEELSYLPMDEQKSMLETVLEGWKGDHEQTDDLLVIGFKLE